MTYEEWVTVKTIGPMLPALNHACLHIHENILVPLSQGLLPTSSTIKNIICIHSAKWLSRIERDLLNWLKQNFLLRKSSIAALQSLRFGPSGKYIQCWNPHSLIIRRRDSYHVIGTILILENNGYPYCILSLACQHPSTHNTNCFA